MIFVTVGTHSQGFERLVKPADELAQVASELIVIQYGSSSYKPQFARHFKWTTSQRMEELTEEARVVIAHAAAGAIILALRKQKALIVVPRSQQHGEHIDDHQLQLAVALSVQGKALLVHEPSLNALSTAIDRVAAQRANFEGAARLVDAVREQLALWRPSEKGQRAG